MKLTLAETISELVNEHGFTKVLDQVSLLSRSIGDVRKGNGEEFHTHYRLASTLDLPILWAERADEMKEVK